MSDIFISTIHKALQGLGRKEVEEDEKIKQCFKLFTLVLEEATAEENISFTTLFSRLAYIGNRDKLPGLLLYQCHTYRRISEQGNYSGPPQNLLALAYYCIYSLMNSLFGTKFELEKYKADMQVLLPPKGQEDIQFIPLMEVIIMAIHPEEKTIIFIDEAEGGKEEVAHFDVAHKNEIFTANILSAYKYAQFPIHANFLEVDRTAEDVFLPAAIILYPDYLVDVTAIAECFSSEGTQALWYLLRKFMPRQSSAPLMIGNIVNYLLDELVSNPDIEYSSLLPKIFKVAPLQFALYDDHQVKEILMKCYHHFLHMKKVIQQDFKQQKIRLANVYLEPSFYSRKVGLQGRLDLLHIDTQRNQLDIVELKSGKPWRPNTYGLSHNHYTQTLLYDQIIQSVFGHRYSIQSYILYSVSDVDQLRFAPAAKAQQWEAAKVRNDLISIEHQLSKIDQETYHILHYLDPKRLPDTKGFIGRDLELFSKVYQGLDAFEKAYFDHFVAFITREHLLAKTGEHGLHKSNGLAALWLEQKEEKEDRFAILGDLEIIENNSQQDPPSISFRRTGKTHPLANFRAGDIAVLYPSNQHHRAVLKNQIFKCSILEMDEEKIVVRLRSKQYNHSIFKQYPYWNIEEDILDSSFNAMYRSLFAFAAAPKEKRNLILGRKAPGPSLFGGEINLSDELTSEQKGVLKSIISARDYYLLWGPPGTGKTSMMLKHYVQYKWKHSQESILLMAYTNRAVDEICAAIESIDPSIRKLYLRIGSSNACHPDYREQLLSHKMDGLTQRKEVMALLKEKRIVVSTVSSLWSNVELLSLRSFDSVVIDEASQILEPMLVGLLPRFDKFVLIGDHKQLPAVVRQNKESGKINVEELREYGFTDAGISLFERLYLQNQEREDLKNIGILSAQGRMHQSIMDFPNRQFYGGQLSIIESVDRLTASRSLMSDNEIEDLLKEERMIYIPTPVDDSYNWKVNLYEAYRVVKILSYLKALFRRNQEAISTSSIGVITPYRAQIAQIKAALLTEEMDMPVTIDTVERYQGGARDIIILSLCTNRLSQLDTLISKGSEGVDRKLNVALTRAREQVILLGNEDILSTNETYKTWIDQAFRWEL